MCSDRRGRTTLQSCLAVCGLLTLQLYCYPAVALQPVVPGVFDPGQLRKQFEVPPRPKPAEPQPSPAITEEVPPPGAEEIRFVLSKVRFEGATAYSADALRNLYTELLGQEVNLSQIYEIANRVTRKYRNDGYILSQAIVPPQRVVEGVVRIRVMEGYVAATSISGEVGGRQSLIDGYAENIKRSRPLAMKRLERNMLLMNDLPGAFARATVFPSDTEVGAADLNIDLSHKKLGFLAGFDNRGSRYLGPERINLKLDLNSVLGRWESIDLRYVQTLDADELKYYAAAYEQPFGTEGRSLGASVDVVDAKPGIGVAIARLATDSVNLNLLYRDPLLRSRTENLYLRGVFAYYNSDNNFSEIAGFEGVLPDTEQKVRVLQVGAAYDLIDRWGGVNLVDVQLAQGLDIFGATEEGDPNATSPRAKPDFTLLRLYAARLQPLWPKWSVLLAVNGQYPSNFVPSSEEFSVGGELFGRAYDAGEIVGSSGLAGKVELRYDGTTTWPLLKAYTLYAMYEGGKVWRVRDPLLDDSLTSAGMGVRFDFAKGIAGYVEANKPLSKEVIQEQNKDTRVFAGISWTY